MVVVLHGDSMRPNGNKKENNDHVRRGSALGARLPSVIEIHALPLYPRTFPKRVIDFPSLFGDPLSEQR